MPPVVFNVTEAPSQMVVSDGMIVTAVGEVITVMVVNAVIIQPELDWPVVLSNAVTV